MRRTGLKKMSYKKKEKGKLKELISKA